jgi:hypothetical protein
VFGVSVGGLSTFSGGVCHGELVGRQSVAKITYLDLDRPGTEVEVAEKYHVEAHLELFLGMCQSSLGHKRID